MFVILPHPIPLQSQPGPGPVFMKKIHPFSQQTLPKGLLCARATGINQALFLPSSPMQGQKRTGGRHSGPTGHMVTEAARHGPAKALTPTPWSATHPAQHRCPQCHLDQSPSGLPALPQCISFLFSDLKSLPPSSFHPLIWPTASRLLLKTPHALLTPPYLSLLPFPV